MKNLIIACTCTMLSAAVFGQGAATPAPTKTPRARIREVPPEQRAKIIAHRMCQNGGFLSIDGKGHLAILNAQTQLGENYGIDTVQAIVKHLPEIGVECAKRITYREACQRGIAPQPTNEFQKAIWDQIHELPSEPITIKKK